MKAIARVMVVGAAAGVAACSSLPGADLVNTFAVESFMNEELSGDSYTDELAKAYQELATHEATVDTNWMDATAFYKKGQTAAAGEEVLPWDPAQFGLSGDIVTAYQQTLSAAAKYKDVRPAPCAQMVAYYDGWVEQAREGSHSITPAEEMQAKWSGAYFDCGGEGDKIAGPFTVYFGFDRSDLDADARAVVDDVVSAVQAYTAPLLSVVGYTDTVGSAAYNQKLSERRAASVEGALVAEGVDADAITASGRGENDLAVETGQGVREPKNRRVEISISE